MSRAAVTVMAKGVQCAPRVRINDVLLDWPADRSPADGSFGGVVLRFDPTLLHVGENRISLQAVDCNGDLDDFEFVNLQIRLQIRRESLAGASGTSNPIVSNSDRESRRRLMDSQTANAVPRPRKERPGH